MWMRARADMRACGCERVRLHARATYTRAPFATIFLAVTFISIAPSACTSNDLTPVITQPLILPAVMELEST
jgi:hypothetical protein